MGQGTPATDPNPDIELGHMPPESEFSRTPAPVLDELQKGQDAAARDCRTDLLSFKREPRFSRDGDMPVFGLYKSPAMILELRELYILKLRHLRIKLATEALGYRYSISEKCPDWADPDARYTDSRAHDYLTAVRDMQFIQEAIDTRSASSRWLRIHSFTSADADLLRTLLKDQQERFRTVSSQSGTLVEQDQGKYSEAVSWSIGRTATLLGSIYHRLLPGIVGGILIYFPMFVMMQTFEKSGETENPSDGENSNQSGYDNARNMLQISGGAVLIFAIFVSFFSNKAVEVFSATSAYAAVMVVFLGATIGG
ncbi:hypothetical protein QC763_0062760 [Podospora pseudopauciseta]|uniref:DUF6594 domain-containing protein n=1 Tax=Podospora pseudopauciseta TaxID=2093780 RepID=A0ABR0HC92_9PEZI|nr:hypothetical protein QC763_0062760 [Podospora pseudopauciseta]